VVAFIQLLLLQPDVAGFCQSPLGFGAAAAEPRGHDGVAAARAGEACDLGEAAHLDGNLLRALDLKDAAGPPRPGREAVLRRGGQVENLAARHHVVIDVDRVNRVGNKDRVVLTEQVQQVAQVALGTVGDENFGHVQLDTVARVIPADSVTQELIALLTGNIAVERTLVALLLNGLVHGLRHGCRQRQGDVADAQTDDVCLGMGLLVVGYLVGNGAEQIALVQLGVMRIQLHDSPPLIYTFI